MNLQYCIYHLLNHAAKASRHMMESDSKALCNSRVPFLCLLIQKSEQLFFFRFQLFHGRDLPVTMLSEEGEGLLILIQFRAMLFPVFFLKPSPQEIFLYLPGSEILTGKMDLHLSADYK